MSDLVITPANVKLVSGVAQPMIGAASSTIAAGQAIGTFNLGAPISNTTPTGRYEPIMLALNNAARGQRAMIAPLRQSVIDLGTTTVNNQLYFLSPNAGGICSYADLQTGNKVIIVGIGLGGTRFMQDVIDTGLVR